MAPTQPLVAGDRGSVWLYCLNDSSNAVSHSCAPSLPGTLTAGSNSFPALLVSTNRSVAGTVIAPGGFVKQEYSFDVPAGISGSATLDVSNFNSIVVQVVAGAPGAAETTPTSSTPPSTNAAARWPVMEFLGRHIYGYEPIYFVLGKYPAAEFQFSLKYKAFDLADDWNPLGHFYFGYTQTSFWDLISRDPSFYDTSYKPSAFLFYPGLWQPSGLRLDLQGGVEHESNGRGGSLERSLNTVYLQPTVSLELPAHFEISLQPRVWEYFALGSNNPNMPDYRGYADLLGALTWSEPKSGEKIQFSTRLRIGDAGDHAGLLFILRFNLPYRSHFNPSVQLQYFTGYGQTLRQYNETSDAFRAGLCIWY
jgi:outer membrane phospholipase A